MISSREERLAAWLDGEMDAAEVRAFEAEIAADPDLATQVAQWRANDAMIAGAFAPIAEQPIETALTDQLGLGRPAQTPAANDNQPWWRRHRLPLGGALAASFAAALLLVPQLVGGRQDPLSQALDDTPSLAQASLPDGRVITPTLTIRAADGRWCREFGAGSDVALACRSRDGKWAIEGQAKGSGPAKDEGYAIASGAEPNALEGVYNRLGASDALSANAEADLITKNWGDHP